MKKPLLAAFLGLSAATAAAQTAPPDRWVSVGSSRTGVAISVDKDTLIRGDGRVTAWVRFVPEPTAKASPRTPTEFKARLRLQCEEMTITTLSFAEYGPNGDYLNGSDRPDPPMAITPESVNEMLWKLLCK